MISSHLAQCATRAITGLIPQSPSFLLEIARINRALCRLKRKKNGKTPLNERKVYHYVVRRLKAVGAGGLRPLTGEYIFSGIADAGFEIVLGMMIK